MNPEDDRVERPHPAAAIITLGLVATIGLLGISSAFHGWWSETLFSLPSPRILAGIFIATLLAHLGEALYAWRTAKRLGYTRSAAAWAIQSFLVGWPATSLIHERAQAARS